MKIYIASDHAGFALKGILHKYLVDNKYDVEDLGPSNEDPVNWAEYGAKVAEKVSHNPEGSKGILICGTGLGMSIVANKFPRVRAALVNDVYSSRFSREHTDANIVVIGARIVGRELAKEIVKVWLDTAFAGGRHKTRLEKIEDLEEKNFKK